MFGGDEDDADFLSPTGGAKLASLFGMDQTVAEQGNESFQYTAPKQPRKGPAATGSGSQKASSAGGAQVVLFATAVHAYRYLNGQYVKQGKIGAAILGNHAAREYKILLYVSQQKQITAARIHPGFTFVVQPNNYSTFYDEQRQNWSIMFESEKAATDFIKQVCLAKYNSSPTLDSVLTQELLLGDSQGVETGDSLEVAYTGWLYQSYSFGQVFDSNVNKDKLLRLKLGSGKVIKGWEEGMVGMKKGGRRLLFIPPALAYGSQGVASRIPPESTLIFEVEVKRVKFTRDSGSDKQSIGSQNSAAPSPVPNVESLATEAVMPPPTTIPPKPGEQAVRAKSNSLSDQLTNPDATKAKLISRMAKMGQPMLPFLTGALSAQPDSSDSEIEDPNTARGMTQSPAQPVQSLPPHMAAQVLQQPVPVHPASSAALLPVSMSAVQPGSSQSFQPYTGMGYGYPQGPAVGSQLHPVGQMFPAQPSQYQASGDVTSFLMTEARQHSTEIRLSVSKVADKIDQLASKMDELQKQNAGNSMLLPGISSVTMETSMIMHNIQRIIQENERLKQELLEKSSRIEEQNGKISELLQRNQRYVEQSNTLMEQRNDSLKTTTESTQARVLQAEQEKVKVAEELATATAQISRLQLELTAHQKKEMALRTQLTAALQEAERHGAQLNTLQSQLIELQETAEQSQAQYKVEKKGRKQLEAKVTTLEEEIGDLRIEKESLEKSLVERKKKSILERQRAEGEMEEIRKSYQEELENLRQLLKKERTSTDQAAAEHMSVMQAELESQWQLKCDRMLASTKEQHLQQHQEVCEQRDVLQQKLSQLEEKFSVLKRSRESEEQKVLLFQEQAEELDALKDKYAALQSRAAVMKDHYEGKIEELNQKVSAVREGAQTPDTAEEVKKIMNGVFQSLRGEFELEESYSGRDVLGSIMNTIKTVTLQLLNRQQEYEVTKSDSEEEEEEEEEEEKEAKQEVKEQGEEKHQEVQYAAKGEEAATSLSIQIQSTAPEPGLLASQTELLDTSGEQGQTNSVLKSLNQSDKDEHTVQESFPPELPLEINEVRQEERTETEPDQMLTQEISQLSLPTLEALSSGEKDSGQKDEKLEVGDEPVTEYSEPLPCKESDVYTENSISVKDDSDSETDKVVSLNSKIRPVDEGKASVPLEVQYKHPGEESQKKAGGGEPIELQKGSPDERDQEEDAPGLPEGPVFEKDNNVLEIKESKMRVKEQEETPGREKTEQKSKSPLNSSSLFDDDDESDLFKTATPKSLKSTITSKQEEEEDEDEVSMKGRPPPAPLFGDEEEEDDLDWLG
ncbi:FK506-binding protein 15 isoform X2 [Latimeria chalumnae]|uniref:FK506-binding protein 15 isoform X2 n=1 Tax=Latimeria chalumnae TaxID=7897 RepID=UPI00313D69D1